MNTKHCETCGKLLIGVKGDRRLCNACAIRRRKAYRRAGGEIRPAHRAQPMSTGPRQQAL